MVKNDGGEAWNASGAGDVDVGEGEVEVDVAARFEAFGQGRRAVADGSRVGNGPAAERAVDDQADVLVVPRGRRSDRLDAEAEATDRAGRLAGDAGDRAVRAGPGSWSGSWMGWRHPDPPGHERPAGRGDASGFVTVGTNDET